MLIYGIRGLTVSLAVFVLTYIALRITVSCVWRLAERYGFIPARSLTPNALYLLQVGPFLLSSIVVAAFTVPAFLRFEPRTVSEEFGPPVVILSAICLGLLGAGIYRALAAYRRTSRLVGQWKRNAVAVEGTDLPIYETGPDTPPLVVAGIFHSKLLISSATSGLLNQEELARAIAHESAHIRTHDNIKKLSLRFCSFPPAKRIEQTWLGALEIAADKYAVSNKREAIDLASALVKSSRLAGPTAELVTNLTSSACELLHTRVARLLAWEQSGNSESGRLLGLATAGLTMTLTVIAVARYDLMLSLMHQFAEMLMR